jgi:hypothetical protein
MSYMGSKFVVVLILVLVVAVAAALLLSRKEGDLRDRTAEVFVKPTEMKRPETIATTETPRVAMCPIARPTENIDSLKDVIANGSESLLLQFKELERLQGKPFDAKAADWLRWMIHQDDRHETLRNEAGKVLLNWDPEWLVGDLAGMMEDPAQSETWRNYCVQHLWALRTQYKDEASLKAVEKAADAADWVVRSQGIFSLANIANEEKWKETQPQRIADLAAKLKQAIQTAKEKGYSHGPSAKVKHDTPEQKAKATERIQKFQITSEDLESAFVSVQMLELKDLAPEAEAFAADESNDLAVRTAAVRALITIGRPESIPVLEKCAASKHRVLAKMADLALKPLRNRQQPPEMPRSP